MSKRKFFPFWIFPTIAALAVATVSLRLQIVRTTYEINQLTNMMRNVQRDVEKAELRVARLNSPQNLEASARRRFALTAPRPEQIIRLGEGTAAVPFKKKTVRK
jgi:hypothetical protein